MAEDLLPPVDSVESAPPDAASPVDSVKSAEPDAASPVDSVESAAPDAARLPMLAPQDAASPPGLRLHPMVARSSGGQPPSLSLLPFSSRSFFRVGGTLSAGELSAFADLNAAAKASETQRATYKIGIPAAPSPSWPRAPNDSGSAISVVAPRPISVVAPAPEDGDDEVHALPSSSGINAAAASNAAPNCQLNVFNRSDPNLTWINGHPYMNRGALGKGSFGVVKKVDLLTPLGYTVCRDVDGIPLFKDVDGDMMLRPLSEKEWGVFLGGDAERRKQLREEIAQKAAGDPAWAQFLNFSGLPCALKDITVIPDDATMDRCLEEVRLLKLLNGVGSEHIVRLYDSQTIWTPTVRKLAIIMELGEMDFQHYLKSRPFIMSTSEGDSCFKIESCSSSKARRGAGDPRKGSMDAVEIFAWWRQMVAGVQAVHSHDIIHSDLKPSNFILVRKAAPPAPGGGEAPRREHEQYTLKLADFGVSRQLRDSQTHLSMANCPGTLLYFAPEMVHSIGSGTTWSHDCKLQVTTAVDIWAMGVILHEMLHDGHTPYGHFRVYGHYRLMCAIADEKAARIRTLCPRLLEEPRRAGRAALVSNSSSPPSNAHEEHDEGALLALANNLQMCSRQRSHDFLRMPAAQRQHDLLLGFQLVQLQHPAGDRPTANHLSVLCDTADVFFGSSNRSSASQGPPAEQKNGGKRLTRQEESENAPGPERIILHESASAVIVDEDGGLAPARPEGQNHAAHDAAGAGEESLCGGRDHSCSVADPFEEGLMALQAVVGRTVAANAHIRMRISSLAGSRSILDGEYIKWLPETSARAWRPRASTDHTLQESEYSLYGAVSPAASQLVATPASSSSRRGRCSPGGRTSPSSAGRGRKTCCGVVKGKKLLFAVVFLLTALAGGFFVWQGARSQASSSSTGDDDPQRSDEDDQPAPSSPAVSSAPSSVPSPLEEPPAGTNSSEELVPVGGSSQRFLPSSSDSQPHQPHDDPSPGTISGATTIPGRSRSSDGPTTSPPNSSAKPNSIVNAAAADTTSDRGQLPSHQVFVVFRLGRSSSSSSWGPGVSWCCMALYYYRLIGDVDHKDMLISFEDIDCSQQDAITRHKQTPCPIP